MKQHSDGCMDWRIFVISFVMALAYACATLPPAQPIRDFKDIAGEWEGNAQTSVGSWTGTGPMTLTIEESGVWKITLPKWDGNGVLLKDVRRSSGMGRLSEGKFDLGGGHTYTLHEGSGKRVIVYAGPNPAERARLEPAQK